MSKNGERAVTATAMLLGGAALLVAAGFAEVRAAKMKTWPIALARIESCQPDPGWNPGGKYTRPRRDGTGQVRFEVAGVPHQVMVQLTENELHGCQAGSLATISLRYDPADPTRFSRAGSLRIGPILIAIFAAACFVVAGLNYAAIRRSRLT